MTRFRVNVQQPQHFFSVKGSSIPLTIGRVLDIMAEFHRKIELQSPDDLQYLISNVRRAAHEKIDRDLPPIEGEDRMRRHVEDLVQEVSCRHPFLKLITLPGL